MFQQKLQYFIRSIANFSQNKQCPNCGGADLDCIDDKFFVTRLLKCEACKLKFRFPVDSKAFLDRFYQSDYQPDYSDVTKAITDLPTDEELSQLRENNFYGKRNYSPFLKALLKSDSSKILDYGCSWGYSVYQMKNSGYDAEGFEISKPRAEFGKKMGITIHHNHESVRRGNDLVMSSHAIEHLPVISDFIKFATEVLKPDGIFMAFCPNGSDEYRQREPRIFHVNWGFLHPNYLDVDFAINAFQRNPYLILTGDWKFDFDLLSSWDGKSQVSDHKLDGQELLIIAKPNIYIR